MHYDVTFSYNGNKSDIGILCFYLKLSKTTSVLLITVIITNFENKQY